MQPVPIVPISEVSQIASQIDWLGEEDFKIAITRHLLGRETASAEVVSLWEKVMLIALEQNYNGTTAQADAERLTTLYTDILNAEITLGSEAEEKRLKEFFSTPEVAAKLLAGALGVKSRREAEEKLPKLESLSAYDKEARTLLHAIPEAFQTYMKNAPEVEVRQAEQLARGDEFPERVPLTEKAKQRLGFVPPVSTPDYGLSKPQQREMAKYRKIRRQYYLEQPYAERIKQPNPFNNGALPGK